MDGGVRRNYEERSADYKPNRLGWHCFRCVAGCRPTQAYGYADPGTGTFVYQAVYAAFIGGEPFLGLMGVGGGLATLWMGALSLVRG